MLQHGLGLLVSPRKQWHTIAELPEGRFRSLLILPILLAIIPAVAWYYGTTVVGWTVGEFGQPVRLTQASALQICVLFYLAMIVCIGGIGYMVHWMADTYGADSSLIKGWVLAGMTATPMLFAGAVGFYPVLWLDMLVGVAAVSWSVYLLYLGIPIIMGISKERGFLFSSAVLAIAMVTLICLMVGSVILWDLGAAPAFTD